MGKIPTIAIVAIVVVLIVGISAGAFFGLIKPKQAELAKNAADLATQEQKVAEKDQDNAKLAQVTKEWLQAQTELAALRERKSIHISMYMPILAMTTMWDEYRKDLPAVIEKYVKDSGCTIISGASMPAPPMAPPTVPASGFMQEPPGQAIDLHVMGTMADLERLYRGLSAMPRVATIGGLKLTGFGDTLIADVPMTLYLIVEGAETAAPPPAAAGGGPGGPGGPPGGPGGPPGAPPGAPGGPGAGVPPTAPGGPGAPGAPPAGPGGGAPKG